jgi:hypothetical protein
LNGSGGLVLAGAGVVHTGQLATTHGWFAAIRELRRRQMRDAHLRWQKRYPERAQAAKRRCWDKNRDQYNAARNEKRKAQRAAERERTAA